MSFFKYGTGKNCNLKLAEFATLTFGKVFFADFRKNHLANNV